MPPLARRNLFHDRVRLVVTLTGIAFSVVLMAIQWGLFRGFSTSTSGVIDYSGADLWVTARNTAYLEQALPFNERRYYQVLATPGVAAATKYIVHWAVWKQPTDTRSRWRLWAAIPINKWERRGTWWRAIPSN